MKPGDTLYRLALSTGTALERVAAELASQDPGSLLYGVWKDEPGDLTGEMVAEAANEGDHAALEAFARVAHSLGVGVANIIHIFDPELVILGGGMSRSGALLLDQVQSAVAEEGIPSLVRDAKVVLSTLGVDAGPVGAAAIAWEGID